MNEHAIIAGALIDAWANRLDSGIPQAQGSLRTREGQCCLGVYCDVAGIPFSFGSEDPEDYPAADYHFGGGVLLGSFPPDRLMKQIGLTDTGAPADMDGWLIPDELSARAEGERVMKMSLAWLNDSAKWTFPQIATLLRHNKARLMAWVNDHYLA
jgi:hypothetical protein